MDDQTVLARLTAVIGDEEKAQAVLDVLRHAQQEAESHRRELLHEGIESARSKGVHIGRPKLVLPDDFPEICLQHRMGVLTIHQAAEALHISPSSFQKLYKQYRQEHP